MSWFDTSGLTSLAKSALKEAQKTIDKALDIQQEENEAADPSIKKQKSLTDAAPPKDSSDFFTSWGITSSSSLNLINTKDGSIITQSPSKAAAQSLWGSFTGSFFEPGAAEAAKTRNSSSDDSSKENIDSEVSSNSDSAIRNDIIKQEAPSVIHRKLSDRNTLNRLSIISSESGKNSSESIEVLGSHSMKTTPDSEGVSLHNSVSASSSMNLKLASSSIEVLPDSLISPSSIELLGFSHSISQNSNDEYGSPTMSPMENEMPIVDASKSASEISSYHNTDEEIKVIANVNNLDDDDGSAADDTISYNSISEFTLPTVLDGAPGFKGEIIRKSVPQYNSEMVDSVGSDTSNSTNRTLEDVPITKPPGRNTTQFSAINLGVQTLMIKDKSESNFDHVIHPSISETFPSSNEDLDTTLEAVNDPKIGPIRTGLLEDAIIEKISDSSSYCKLNEDAEVAQTNWKEGALSTSSYEEVDKASSIDILESDSHPTLGFSHREPNSPVSSEGVSIDMVKIGSEQTSGHTSGDDLETTTSSDIEIIPSPNGDYGNNYGCQSPAKLPNKFHKHPGNVVDLVLGKALASKIRGHTRELSAASNQSNASDDSHCSEVDRLMKRLAEMAEVLESREAKLIEISRHNVELNESNSELKLQIDNLSKQDIADVSLITEEYTQRLSALEKKFQQAIREKDAFRKQMEGYRQEVASRMTANDLETAISERDEIIKELREEGEKLSKQQLHHTTIIKKLRAKEKENEQVIKTLRDKVAEQMQELDRLKRSVSAKEAVECTQIEAVYKLTTANKKLDAELLETKEQLDDVTQKHDTLKKSFDAAKKEITDLQRNCNDNSKIEETLSVLEREKTAVDSENEQLAHQIEDLRSKIRQDEQRWMAREATLRSEAARQLARAEEAESALQLSKNELGGFNSSDGTCADGGLLLAQISALQESALERDRRFQATERRLQQTASEAQSNLVKAHENNQQLKDENQTIRSKLASIEMNLEHTVQKLETSLSACEEHMSQLNITLDSKEKLKNDFDCYKHEASGTIKELNERIQAIEESLTTERNSLDAEKRRNTILQEQLRDVAISSDQACGSSLLLARLVGTGPAMSANMDAGAIGNSCEQGDHSPPPESTGRESYASESLGSGIHEEGESSLIGNMRDGGGICTVERLQAALQRLEGELKAARKAGRRSQAQRTALARELALHAAELDTMQSVQHQYDALLQMYGEKEEQLQELRLDLQDVKDMYKMQLDEILMLKRRVHDLTTQQNK